MNDFGIDICKPTTIFEDNQACIYLLDKWEHKRLKHIDIKYHYVKDLYKGQKIVVVYIPTCDQKADILTKALSGVQYAKLRDCLCVGAKSDEAE